MKIIAWWFSKDYIHFMYFYQGGSFNYITFRGDSHTTPPTYFIEEKNKWGTRIPQKL